MYLTEEAMAFFDNNEWIEDDEEGFAAGQYGYKLKPGAPQEIQDEFNEIKALIMGDVVFTHEKKGNKK